MYFSFGVSMIIFLSYGILPRMGFGVKRIYTHFWNMYRKMRFRLHGEIPTHPQFHPQFIPSFIPSLKVGTSPRYAILCQVGLAGLRPMAWAMNLSYSSRSSSCCRADIWSSVLTAINSVQYDTAPARASSRSSWVRQPLSRVILLIW